MDWAELTGANVPRDESEIEYDETRGTGRGASWGYHVFWEATQAFVNEAHRTGRAGTCDEQFQRSCREEIKLATWSCKGGRDE